MTANPSAVLPGEMACTVPSRIVVKLRWPVICGAFASIAMLAMYFGVLSLVSGWGFAASQFRSFWYYVLPLAFGFGVQVGLYLYLRKLALHPHHAGSVVATAGTTSTAAMISCCAHYLANILPAIGAAGIVTAIAQYQVELFWLGLILNTGGVAYIAFQILQARSPAIGRWA
jgi:Cu+-exporting ATPase